MQNRLGWGTLMIPLPGPPAPSLLSRGTRLVYCLRVGSYGVPQPITVVKSSISRFRRAGCLSFRFSCFGDSNLATLASSRDDYVMCLLPGCNMSSPPLVKINRLTKRIPLVFFNPRNHAFTRGFCHLLLPWRLGLPWRKHAVP